jgi:hypothetical protein
MEKIQNYIRINERYKRKKNVNKLLKKKVNYKLLKKKRILENINKFKRYVLANKFNKGLRFKSIPYKILKKLNKKWNKTRRKLLILKRQEMNNLFYLLCKLEKILFFRRFLKVYLNYLILGDNLEKITSERYRRKLVKKKIKAKALSIIVYNLSRHPRYPKLKKVKISKKYYIEKIKRRKLRIEKIKYVKRKIEIKKEEKREQIRERKRERKKKVKGTRNIYIFRCSSTAAEDILDLCYRRFKRIKEDISRKKPYKVIYRSILYFKYKVKEVYKFLNKEVRNIILLKLGKLNIISFYLQYFYLRDLKRNILKLKGLNLVKKLVEKKKGINLQSTEIKVRETLVKPVEKGYNRLKSENRDKIVEPVVKGYTMLKSDKRYNHLQKPVESVVKGYIRLKSDKRLNLRDKPIEKSLNASKLKRNGGYTRKSIVNIKGGSNRKSILKRKGVSNRKSMLKRKGVFLRKAIVHRKEILKRKVLKTKKRLRYIGLSFLIKESCHIGKILKKNTYHIISPYLLCRYSERGMFNVNIMVVEIRRMLKVIDIKSNYFESLIINVPIRLFRRNILYNEKRLGLNYLVGERNEDVPHMIERYRRYSIGRFSLITRWIGGLMSNYIYFKRKLHVMMKLNREDLNREEKTLVQLLNITVPGIFISFNEDYAPINEAKRIRINAFVFVDAHYNGTIKEQDINVSVIPISVTMNVINIIIILIRMCVRRARDNKKRFGAKKGKLTLPYIRSYRNFFFDPEPEIVISFRKNYRRFEFWRASRLLFTGLPVEKAISYKEMVKRQKKIMNVAIGKELSAKLK